MNLTSILLFLEPHLQRCILMAQGMKLLSLDAHKGKETLSLGHDDTLTLAVLARTVQHRVGVPEST